MTAKSVRRRPAIQEDSPLDRHPVEAMNAVAGGEEGGKREREEGGGAELEQEAEGEEREVEEVEEEPEEEEMACAAAMRLSF